MPCSNRVGGRPRPPQYTIVDLGLLPGGGFAEARDVNDRGQIVGWGSTATGETHAILWDNGEAIDLGTLAGSSSRAFGINNRGHICHPWLIGEPDTRCRSRRDTTVPDGEAARVRNVGTPTFAGRTRLD